MSKVYILCEQFVHSSRDIHGTYSNRADVEEAYLDFCENWAYEVMMTEDPEEVFGREWNWKEDYKYIMDDCAHTLKIMEADYYD